MIKLKYVGNPKVVSFLNKTSVEKFINKHNYHIASGYEDDDDYCCEDCNGPRESGYEEVTVSLNEKLNTVDTYTISALGHKIGKYRKVGFKVGDFSPRRASNLDSELVIQMSCEDSSDGAKGVVLKLMYLFGSITYGRYMELKEKYRV